MDEAWRINHTKRSIDRIRSADTFSEKDRQGIRLAKASYYFNVKNNNEYVRVDVKYILTDL